MPRIILKSVFIALTLGLTSCGTELVPAQSQLKIRAGTAVTSADLVTLSTVSVDHVPTGMRCTGVIVGALHVLTASHCQPQVNSFVHFYSGPLENGEKIKIVRVILPSGVSPAIADFTDSGNVFADVALIKLETPINLLKYRIADLPSPFESGLYGVGASGWPVGVGAHDNLPNFNFQMRWTNGSIASNENGSFHASAAVTDGGDSGGPFYVTSLGRLKVLGILHGIDPKSKYTKVIDQLPFIVSSMLQ